MNTSSLMESRFIINAMKKPCRHQFVSSFTLLLFLLMMGFMIMISPSALLRLLHARPVESTSVWLFRVSEELEIKPITKENLTKFYPGTNNFNQELSPFMIGSSTGKSQEIFKAEKSDRSSKIYTISYYDPRRELQFFERADFSKCQYISCRMTDAVEAADAVIFYAAKLKNSPTPKFRRNPEQIWILKTDEAPSRFSWFLSLNRTGIRDQINWTMTHKLDSDIIDIYGRLTENDQQVDKNYDKIYEGKTKTAAWFVSHCPVRSERNLYVTRMASRTDIDIYGACGTLTCGQGEKIPGVVGMRIQADKETCFPLLSKTYKFYMALENSLCQEYVTEKFFKIFSDVDVVPVVRGGADYKMYFPPKTFVDAADFSSPETLADFLDDLGNDKERYLAYLRNKNRYRVVWDFPDWQCKLCEKLHKHHGRKVYENIHDWYTQDSCFDPKDFYF